MLTYHFDNQSKIPMYEYLYQCLKQDIIEQKLVAHEKLPSKRKFAKHLHVSLITIENAYQQLLLEGYLYSIEKKGYFVQDIDFPEHPIQQPLLLDEIPSIPYLIDLKTNSVSVENFPFSIWSKLTRQVLSTQSPELLSRVHPQGCLSLREAIAAHLYAFSGMSVSPQQIVIGAGTEYLYNLVIQLLGRDKHYALENPGHQSIARIYTLNHVNYQFLSLDKEGLSYKELVQSTAQIIHISPAHHYPTGLTMPIQRRLDILKWAKQNNGYIIEDDYDSEFRLRGKPLPSLFQTDQDQRVIYMNTFSKTLAPSFRISYMVLPPQLVAYYREKFAFLACSVSSFEQLILAEFIKNNNFEKHIHRMRHAYKMVRDELLFQIQQSSFSQYIHITEENAGLHFLLHHQFSDTDEIIIKKAQTIHLNISTLSQYYEDAFESQTLVINYSGLSYQDIPLAVSLLQQLFTPSSTDDVSNLHTRSI